MVDDDNHDPFDLKYIWSLEVKDNGNKGKGWGWSALLIGLEVVCVILIFACVSKDILACFRSHRQPHHQRWTMPASRARPRHASSVWNKVKQQASSFSKSISRRCNCFASMTSSWKKSLKRKNQQLPPNDGATGDDNIEDYDRIELPPRPSSAVVQQRSMEPAAPPQDWTISAETLVDDRQVRIQESWGFSQEVLSALSNQERSG
ncbi:MAG: hypothetical protein M1825_005585 [Sarcosagium campestre]|nr:MAG: hypothetical protein M1825_005585 [Sarcosagium campestre]